MDSYLGWSHPTPVLLTRVGVWAMTISMLKPFKLMTSNTIKIRLKSSRYSRILDQLLRVLSLLLKTKHLDLQSISREVMRACTILTYSTQVRSNTFVRTIRILITGTGLR
jgi:hypothetical protein